MAKNRGVTQYLDVLASVYSTFYDIETDALLVLNDKGIVERVSPGFEKLTGYVEADIAGRMITQIITFGERDDPIRLLHKGGGEIKCWVVASRFRQGKVYLVIRPI